MTFDQFANQGGTAAWDADEAAATKKVADRIFSTPPTETAEAVATDVDDERNRELADPEPDNPEQPGEIEDPDISTGN